jgi:hypothetical protein
MAIFLWNPKIIDNTNKTFIVYVTATALNNETNENENIDHQRLVAKTQFSLVITNDSEPNMNYFANSETVVADLRVRPDISQSEHIGSHLQDFTIRPKEHKIKTIANHEWNNEIIFHGISLSKLNKPPTVRISNSPENNGGTIFAPIIKENSILLQGKTPFAGASRVFVTVVRNGDLRETTVSFERYINGQLLGQKYNIRVLDFPSPEITRISRRSKNDVILEVTSFGLHNDRENNIREIKLTGNAKAIQEYGKSRTDKAKLEHYEQYQIVPLDASKPFSFEATAVDQRNQTSKPKSYNGD